MDKSPSTSSKNWISYVLSALGMIAITAAISAYLIWTPTGANALHLATTKQPERYTELYFDNSYTLPLHVTPGKSYRFGFRVTNQEYATTAYTAKATMTVGRVTQPLISTAFTLPQGGSKDTVVAFVAPRTPSEFIITVTLPGQNETVYFRGQS